MALKIEIRYDRVCNGRINNKSWWTVVVIMFTGTNLVNQPCIWKAHLPRREKDGMMAKESCLIQRNQRRIPLTV
jgi:hypothetical protein